MFGKSFYDITNKVIERYNAIENLKKNGVSPKDASQQVGGLFSYVFADKSKDKLVKEFEEFKAKMEETGKSAEDLAKEMGDQLSSEIQDYIKTSINGEISTEGFKASINGLSLSAKAGKIALKGLAIAGSMLATFLVSELISGIFQVISASNDIREQAQEVGSAFNSTESDINSYKERVQELHDTINDSQSSFQDITDARKELSFFRLQIMAYSFDTYILQLTFFNFHLSRIIELAIYRCLFSDSIQVHCHFNWICNDCYLSFYTIHLYH